MSEKFLRFSPALVLTVTLGLAFLPLTGCKKKSGSSAGTPLNIVAVDRSGSTEAMRAKQITLLGTALVAAQERDERFEIWVVDRKAAPIFLPQTVHLGNQLPSGLLAELRTPPKDRATRTRPSLFWEQVAQKYGGAAPASGADKVRIAYLTDGGNDWVGDEARMKKAIKTLSENPQVNVAVIGVDKDLIASMEEQFAPFGQRFLLRGREIEPKGIEAWREGSSSE